MTYRESLDGIPVLAASKGQHAWLPTHAWPQAPSMSDVHLVGKAQGGCASCTSSSSSNVAPLNQSGQVTTFCRVSHCQISKSLMRCKVAAGALPDTSWASHYTGHTHSCIIMPKCGWLLQVRSHDQAALLQSKAQSLPWPPAPWQSLPPAP